MSITNLIQTKIVYLDESGDSGKLNDSKAGSDYFILSSVYMNSVDWHNNFNEYKTIRRSLRNEYGLHVTEEFHTKAFLNDHNPYRKYNWDYLTRKKLFFDYVSSFKNIEFESVNVIIDKSIIFKQNYRVLENALKYNIQRIENTYKHGWNYIIISDNGRIGDMRKIARSICSYNLVPIISLQVTENKPIKGMVEDLLGKDSKDSPFIQIADCISYIINLYYKTHIKKKPLPKRVSNVLNESDILELMNILDQDSIFNHKASSSNPYGIVIAPI